TGGPRQKQGVDDTGDRSAAFLEGAEDRGEGLGADGSGPKRVGFDVIHVLVEAVVVAIGVRDVADEAVVDFSIGRAGKHAAVAGQSGGEGDPGAGDAREAPGEVEGRIDVPLKRVGHHKEMLLHRTELLVGKP
ncbi:hypothetical protein BHM03_00020550, partial [Ensete ventricosum]